MEIPVSTHIYKCNFSSYCASSSSTAVVPSSSMSTKAATRGNGGGGGSQQTIVGELTPLLKCSTRVRENNIEKNSTPVTGSFL